MKAVNIVTIKKISPLFKGDIPANSIELVELEEFEEFGFEIVSKKDLYKVGDTAIFIQPDYNLSDIPLFESYIRPNGDESKSTLGKVGGLPRRVRAKKFNNFSKEPNGDVVYSNGILLPYNEVKKYIWKDVEPNDKSLDVLSKLDLAKELGITKYEEPEYVSKSGLKVEGSIKFPSGLYKTDEENINNLWNKITFPIELVGTEKVDGSSITIGVTDEIPEGFICSRNLRKKLTFTKIVGRRTLKWYEKLLFWKKYDLNIYQEVESEDDFVKYGKPYLDKLLKYNFKGIFRGELNGGHLKGSSNKNNPASKEPVNIKFFGVDNKKGEKFGYFPFKKTANLCSFPLVETIFIKEFHSKEELVTFCNDYFKKNMIEGIVVRTLNSAFSAKIMNLEYDSKK